MGPVCVVQNLEVGTDVLGILTDRLDLEELHPLASRPHGAGLDEGSYGFFSTALWTFAVLF
jgi:hypothetical protein